MTTPSQSATRIFISHSSKDDVFGTQLAEDLRRILSDETVIWYDTRGGLKPGDRWFQKIEEELIACNIFIIIISPDAMESVWVRREFDIALNEKKFIIPVLYRQSKIWPYLKTIHYVSFLPPKLYKIAFQELLMSIFI